MDKIQDAFHIDIKINPDYTIIKKTDFDHLLAELDTVHSIQQQLTQAIETLEWISEYYDSSDTFLRDCGERARHTISLIRK